MPDPGVAMQLVHHDDVATAIALAAMGAGEPGAYNLAADGEVSLRAAAEWMHVGRGSVVMDTSRAKDVLGRRPQYTSRETLAALAEIL